MFFYFIQLCCFQLFLLHFFISYSKYFAQKPTLPHHCQFPFDLSPACGLPPFSYDLGWIFFSQCFIEKNRLGEIPSSEHKHIYMTNQSSHFKLLLLSLQKHFY